MELKRTYTKYSYLVDSVLWSGIALITYNFTLFRKLDYLSETASFTLFIRIKADI